MLTTADLAARWNVGRTTIYQWLERGEMPKPVERPGRLGKAWPVRVIRTFEDENGLLPVPSMPMRRTATGFMRPCRLPLKQQNGVWRKVMP